MSNPFIVKNINLFCSYIYNFPTNQDCTFCRFHLNESSLSNQEKCVDSTVVTGFCGHSFHNDCMKLWIKQSNFCPLCSEKWEYLPINYEKTILDESTQSYDDKIKEIKLELKKLEIHVNK